MLSHASDILLDHAPPEVKRRWLHRVRWALARHPYQVPPEGDWRGWMLQAGRGAGKTLTGADDAIEHSLHYPRYRYGIVAPTLGDAREIVMEGETGLLNVLTNGTPQMPGLGLAEGTDFTYNRTRLEIDFPNKSHIKAYGSEKPDRLRGPQHHRLWFEELASFKDAYKGDGLQTTFNNALLGLRLKGFGPTRYIVTTTPRPVKLIADLAARENVVVSRGSTYDNLDNLDPEFAAEILRYEGTHLGRQELLGEIITQVPGALWQWSWINTYRLAEVPEMVRIVVGVDPSGGSDEIGIVAAGKIQSPCPCGDQNERGPHYAVLADASLEASPEQWSATAINLYQTLKADRIIAERNFGGEMVESTMRAANRHVPVKVIHASRGKAQRAEPVSAVYEQGRVHHVDGFLHLESEMTSWVPGESDWSPNRIDALVWAMNELGLDSGLPTRLHGADLAKLRIGQ